jgi:tetratricopeptide (TPR) repeat protein
LAFALALLAKTSVVMLPVVLLSLALWQRGKIEKRDVLRTLPFFALSLALGLVTVWFQTHRAIGYKSDPALTRIAGGGWAIWFYLFKALVPLKLAMIYPRWEINAKSIVAWLPWVAWLGTLVFLFKSKSSWGRPILFVLGYFFITLLPVLGFFDMSFFAYSRAADHLGYLSIIGIAALAGAVLTQGFKKPRTAHPARPRFKPLSAVVIAVLFVLSWQRSQVFFNSERLWSDTLSKNPKAWVAYNNLGEAIVSGGGEVTRAMQLFETALQLKPDYQQAHNNMGNAYSDLKQFSESYPHYAKAIEIQPDYAEAENNWGLALARADNVDEAIQHFEKALKHAPHFAQAHFNLGIALVRKGKLEEGAEQYRAALVADPAYIDARLNLAMVLADLKKTDEAEKEYNETIRRDPDVSEAYNGLGILMIDKKNYAEAVRCFREAVRLDPQNPNLQRNLDRATEKMARGR